MNIFSLNWALGVLRDVEPMCAIWRPMPSPTIMLLEPMYGTWSDGLHRLEVMWWETPLSKSYVGELEVLVVKWGCGCHEDGGICALEVLEDSIGTRWTEGQCLEKYPWIW